MNNLKSNSNSTILSRIFRKKNADELIEASKKTGLKKTLTGFDLIVLGIGAVIGSGIFTLAGTAAAGSASHVGAGPGLMLSFVIAAIACALSALCYAEFASMIPVAGSAYTYTFATLGEISAWLIGWILMLEYAIGNITVACSWTGYLFQFLQGLPFLPEIVKNPPIWFVNDYATAVHEYRSAGIDAESVIPHLFGIPLAMNYPAILIILLVTAILYKGIQESTRMAGLMVIIKMAVILLFIGVGSFYVKPDNWTPFMPNGFEGVFLGAFLVFFAYIGFDAVSTAAEETKDPQKNLPIGIIGSLIICTIVYMLVAGVLTGMISWNLIDTHAPIAAAMRMVGQDWVAGLISIGALTGLTSVLLVLQLGTTRILFAMARDRFLPSVFSKVHDKYKTPHIITVATGIFVAIGSMFLDLNKAAELCNVGTLTAFMVVCIGVLILRKTDPDRYRPFSVPYANIIAPLGILLCLGLIGYALYSIKLTAILFLAWIAIGIVIYFSYGYRKNNEFNEGAEKSLQIDIDEPEPDTV